MFIICLYEPGTRLGPGEVALCLQKLGPWGHRHNGVVRAPRAENTNLRARLTIPAPPLPSLARAHGRVLHMATKSRHKFGVCAGSLGHGLLWKCRPGATFPRARSDREEPQGDGTARLPGSLQGHASSYLRTTHTNRIVFLSNNRETELGLGGDQI